MSSTLDRVSTSGSFLSPIDRAGAGRGTPLFARAYAASKIVADQSEFPLARNRLSTFRCSSSNIPARIQAVKRWWVVRALTPAGGGATRNLGGVATV